ANLATPNGDLQLSGGTVVSTGQLSGDRITIATVAGGTVLNPDLTTAPATALATLPNPFDPAVSSLEELFTEAGDGVLGSITLENSLLSVNGATIVNLGDVFVSALSTNNPEGDGGAVNLLSNSNLSAETIDASGLVSGGNITLTADEIDLIGGLTSVTSQGELRLQPLNSAQPIAIAASSNQTGTLTLTTSDLAALADGFSQITIGRDDSSGQIELLETVNFCRSDGHSSNWAQMVASPPRLPSIPTVIL
ncbi:hypothetical protein HC928_25145, partial [bacterium]|nr:hypothetical protein [bacterium]